MVPSKNTGLRDRTVWRLIVSSALLAILMAIGAEGLAAQSPAGFPVDPGYGFPKTPVINPIPKGSWARTGQWTGRSLTRRRRGIVGP